jgi:hypothetical protein
MMERGNLSERDANSATADELDKVFQGAVAIGSSGATDTATNDALYTLMKPFGDRAEPGMPLKGAMIQGVQTGIAIRKIESEANLDQVISGLLNGSSKFGERGNALLMEKY